MNTYAADAADALKTIAEAGELLTFTRTTKVYTSPLDDTETITVVTWVAPCLVKEARTGAAVSYEANSYIKQHNRDLLMAAGPGVIKPEPGDVVTINGVGLKVISCSALDLTAHDPVLYRVQITE